MRQSMIDQLQVYDVLIWACAWGAARKYNHSDVEELYSMGREEIVRKAHKWDAQRGKFTTFATRVLRNHFNRYFRDEQRHYGTPHLGENQSVPEWMATLPDPKASALPSRLWDVWESCSPGVKDVIEICLTTSLEDVYGGKFTLTGLKEELLKRNWNDLQIQIAVGELRELIRDW